MGGLRWGKRAGRAGVAVRAGKADCAAVAANGGRRQQGRARAMVGRRASKGARSQVMAVANGRAWPKLSRRGELWDLRGAGRRIGAEGGTRGWDLGGRRPRGLTGGACHFAVAGNGRRGSGWRAWPVKIEKDFKIQLIIFQATHNGK
jgi:hypothetical protein